MLEKLEQLFEKLRGVQVAVLGLAFKPNTDDMRDAPSIPIIQALLKQGVKVTAHDPIAMEAAELIFGEKITYADSPEAALDGAEAVLILTEWNDYIGLDWAAAKARVKTPIVIDGRNCLEPATLRELGYVYQSIGRN